MFSPLNSSIKDFPSRAKSMSTPAGAENPSSVSVADRVVISETATSVHGGVDQIADLAQQPPLSSSSPTVATQTLPSATVGTPPPTVLMMQDVAPSLSATNVSVHRLDSPDSAGLKELVDSFPDTALFRIVNEHFVETALRTGTDKGDVERRDVRRLTGEGGYDVWGVESNLAQLGLTKADVLCATPKEYFLENGKYQTSALGLPADRSAILVFDGGQLTPIDETDGYRFNNPDQKRAALLGVITFPRQLRAFEHEMEAAPTVTDKVTILEREVRLGLQTQEDLRDRADLLSVLITNSLYDAPEGAEATRLVTLAGVLKQRSFFIENWDNLQRQLESAARVPDNEHPQRKARRLRQPDFVIKSAQELLHGHPDMPAEFVERFQKIIEGAQALGQQFAAS